MINTFVRRNTVLLCGLAAIGYLLFTLLLIPASWALNRFTLPVGMSFHGVEGSVLEGEIKTLRWRDETVRNIRWSFHWRALLQGRVAVEVYTDEPDLLTGRAVLTYDSSWSISEANVRFPAVRINPYIQSTFPLSTGGSIEIAIEKFLFTPSSCLSLSGHAEWQQAVLNSSLGQLNLGNTAIQLSCVNNKIDIVIGQTAAQMSSRSQLLVDMQGGYQFQGELTPSELFPPVLYQLLKAGTRETGNGVYTMMTAGHF